MSNDRLQVILGHIMNTASCGSSITPHLVSSGRRDSPPHFEYTLNNPFLSLEQRQFYEDNGFLVIKSLVPLFSMNRWRNRFMDLVEGRAHCKGITIMKDISHKGQENMPRERVVNKLQSFAWDDVLSEHCQLPQVLDYVECFTGPNVMAMHTMLINKPPDAGTRSSRHPLHQDLHYFPFRPANRVVCAWTAMEKIDTNNGCLFVIPGSHKNSLERHDYPNWENGVNKMYHGVLGYDNHPKVMLEMEEGDTVFFHPILLHGSGDNCTQRFRKAISCHYAASECHYIDVNGTTQEHIAKEVEDVAHRKGLEGMTFKDIFKLRSRCVRGREVYL